MDTSRLPIRPLIDTGVFLRCLRRVEDSRTPDCVAFVTAMLGLRRPMFVAAPSIAEITRHAGVAPPHTPGIVVAPLDEPAARRLGELFPMSVIHTAAQESGWSRAYLKYDAMIVACAVRARADCIVSLDDEQRVLAAKIGLASAEPASFKGAAQPPPPAQGSLPIE